MFVAAIERATAFTRAIHTIARFHGSKDVVPGAATLFFVNSDGWALTCKHVAQQVLAADQLFARFVDFKAKRASFKGHKREKHLVRDLERQFGYQSGVVVELFNNFTNCIEGPLQADVQLHPDLDIALLGFRGHTKLLCTAFPTFAKQDGDLKQGKFLCRLGFPFPEFTNFEYDPAQERIRWTQTGRLDTPCFPIDGMVSRHLLGPKQTVIGFEISTPGLRGQSGGPAFDSEGRVWGMQSGTNHLDLDFDVHMDVVRKGQKRTINHDAVLHVGHCIHVSELKAFMLQHGASFEEG